MKRSRASYNKAHYKKLFLKRGEIKTRNGKSVYIRNEYHQLIMKIIHSIGKNEYSMSDYIDNVLAQHFAIYKEEINTLYKENKTEIFNP